MIHSEQNKKENEKILEDFSKAETGVLHTSKMLDEGADIPGLSVAIVCGFNSSKITTRQRIGRCIRREGNKTAEIFFLVLKGCSDDKWFKKANEYKEKGAEIPKGILMYGEPGNGKSLLMKEAIKYAEAPTLVFKGEIDNISFFSKSNRFLTITY